jgi:hypothetical protein
MGLSEAGGGGGLRCLCNSEVTKTEIPHEIWGSDGCEHVMLVFWVVMLCGLL